MWKKYNPNPKHNRVGDCVVRAICKLLDKTWEDAYCDLAAYGLMRCDMPNSNAVWGAYLRDRGFERKSIDSVCADCYTVADFASEHFRGKYLLAISGHVVAIEDGDWFDSWDSADEAPQYFWEYIGGRR